MSARCVLYYSTILARGPAARPRCIPPACGASRSHLPPPMPRRSREPDQRQRNVLPFHHSQASGRCTAAQGSRRAPPRPPWPTCRRWITTGVFAPLDPRPIHGDQPCAVWMPIRSFEDPIPTTKKPPCSLETWVNLAQVGCAPAFRLWITGGEDMTLDARGPEIRSSIPPRSRHCFYRRSWAGSLPVRE